MHDGMWHFGWMWVLWIPLFVFFAWLVATMIRSLGKTGDGSTNRPDSPEEILKRRYASGEIGKDEYDRRLAEIRR